MKIQHSAFRGEIPILDARLLPENNAQVARNVYLRRGTLMPQKSPRAVSGLPDIANPSTLYRYPGGNDGKGYWFAWGGNKKVDVVKSPLANDQWHRIYWTGDGPPKMAGVNVATSGSPPYPGSHYRLGIPAPSGGLSVSEPGDRDLGADIPDTALETAYVVTLVSSYGEEGPPSSPSRSIIRWDSGGGAPAGGGVDIGLPSVPAGAYDIAAKRLYRVESSGVYQYVADFSASDIDYTDNVPSDGLGRAIPSIEWDAPDPRMVGLTAMPNGILAGFFENTLCFSEAYLPHAWPVSYQLALTDDIVGIASTSAGLVVVTKGQPQLVSGSSPEAMAQIELDVNQSCVSARSLVDMGEYAIYASPDGLVAAAGRDAKVVTLEVMSREQWQELSPSSIHAYRHEGKYLAFYTGGCFLFTPGEGFEFYDISASAGYYDISDNRLYLVQNGSITAWGEGSPMGYTWRSRIHEIPPGGAGFNCAKVIARDYPVTLRIFANGDTVINQNVRDHNMFRLPSGYTLSRDWEIEVAGSREVHSVQIATSPGELI